MKRLIIYMAIANIIVFVISCQTGNEKQNNSQVETKRVLSDFDISKNDSLIIFSMRTKNGSSIYQMNIDGTEQRKIISSNKNISYFSPRYSKDGKKIVFKKYSKTNSLIREICIANSDGSNVEQLTNLKENITDAIFSSYSNEIYFLKATEYGNYSPLAPEQAHGFDIYSLDLSTKEEKRISKLNAYGLHFLAEFDSTSLLVTLQGGDEGGMFLCQKSPFKLLKRIVPKNNPRRIPSLYYAAKYSKTYNSLIFSAPYELYIMDMDTKMANLLFSNVGHTTIDDFYFFNTLPKVLFKKENDLSLFSINVDGSGLEEIPITINE
jgi:hypothetical protein